MRKRVIPPHQRWCFHTCALVEFSIFLISLLGQMEPSNRGYSVGFLNDKQEGVELLRGHIENMFPHTRHGLSDGNLRSSASVVTSLNLIGLFF